MDLDMVFNELSILSPAGDIHIARKWMSDLVDTIRTAAVAGVNRNLRTNIDINNAALATDYLVAKWRNDEAVDREKRGYFRSVITRCPSLIDLPEVKDELLSCDFLHQNDDAQGLGIAYLLDSLAISFPSGPKWDAHEIDLEARWLGKDGNLTCEPIKTCHASKACHIDRLRDWIKSRLRPSVRDGKELWKRRNELFPSLLFCRRIEKDLRSLDKGSPMLRQVLIRLLVLDSYCRNWQTGPFDPDGLPYKTTSEGDATCERYGKERTFLCPDGQKRLFRWHCRLTPSAWRIYIDPEPGPGKMFIGYIGPKLPSVDYPG